MENPYKETRFDRYCAKCKYADLPEFDDPCDMCLNEPYGVYSHKPMYWEPSDGNEGYLPPERER